MLQIFVTHNIRIRGASTPIRAAITRALTIENPAYKKAKRIGKRAWGIPPKLELFIHDQGDLVTPRGFENQLNGILTLGGIDPKKVTSRRQTTGKDVNFGWNPAWKLRSYQEPFIEAVTQQNGVGIAPAGSGKTIMGLRYISEKGRAAIWLTHTTDLMYQTAAKAEKLLPNVGKIGFFGDGSHDWGDGNLIMATVQTLQKNGHLIDAMNEFVGTVVIDEAHHFPAVQFIDTAGRFTAENMLGVTATPERKDGLECYMYNGIGPQLHRVERDDLYDSGELIKPKVEFVYTEFNFDSASDRNEIDSVEAGGDDMDYSAVLQRLIQDPTRLTLVAQSILDASEGQHSIVIAESVRYSFQLRDMVAHLAALAGKPLPRMAVVHGGISRYKWVRVNHTHHVQEGDENVRRNKRGLLEVRVENYTQDEMQNWQVSAGQRKEIMAACDRKEIDILFATQLAREGLDMPHLTVGHMVMPKRGDDAKKGNGGSVEQEIGRIQRKDPSNPEKRATWYDYVDYNVGVFRQQYNSRRKVYKRLGIKVPNKPRTERQEIESFMNSGKMFDLPDLPY